MKITYFLFFSFFSNIIKNADINTNEIIFFNEIISSPAIESNLYATENYFSNNKSYYPIEFIVNVLNLFTISIQKEENNDNKNVLSFLHTHKNNEIDLLLNTEVVQKHQQPKKNWTILVYIAGDNDLFKYALRNIYQMMNIGSSPEFNLVIHFDFHARGMPKMTKRYYVMKDKLLQISELPAGDSGNPKNLINAAQWAISNYPSNFFGLILWNHGTGSVDPNDHSIKNIVRPELFFEYDPYRKIITLKKNIDFLSLVNNKEDMSPSSHNDRGICFDETSKNYLNNRKLEQALKIISGILNKKIDILLFDACLMMGVEIAHACCSYVHYLVGSEEVVLGPGYNYGLLFQPLLKDPLLPHEYALYAVKSYAQTYAPISRDFTESALDLTHFNEFINEFTVLVKQLLFYLSSDQKELIKKTLKFASTKNLVTHFAEPSYIDLKHFLDNIVIFLSQNKKNYTAHSSELECINTICNQINKKIFPVFYKIVVANVTGSQNPKAQGIYIYFPNVKNAIEPGYSNTNFATLTSWLTLIKAIKNF